MRRFAEDMDRLFGDFGFGGRALGLSPLGSTLGRDLWGGSPFEETAWAPPVEVVQRGDRLVIRADLPGLRKDDIDIDIDKGVLILRGERQQVHEDTSEGYYRSERNYGAFSRSIPLPDGADATKAEATFKDGVLEVIVPAPQRAERSRKIEIR
jgi:HSP20 family protein